MKQLIESSSNITFLTTDAFSNASDERVKEYRRKWRENPVQHHLERFPIHLDIESTSICNLKCIFCASTYECYTYGTMSFDLFRQIIDEGSIKGLCSIKLNFRGEPLLQPKIAEMVAYAKRRGILDVFFNTNATLLTEDIGKKLIMGGLDRLIVSFEGVTPEVYERNRVGATFNTVVDNIRNFVRLRRSLGSATPVVRLQTVAVDESPDYLERYREFWHDWADEMTCVDRRDELADYSDCSSAGWECPDPWRRLLITWDGQILTCPLVNRALNSYQWQGLGHIGETTIEAAWHSASMETIRNAHCTGTAHTIEPCRCCSYRGSELSKRLLEEP